MVTIRLYVALMWLGRWLAKLPLTDRWGCRLGDDLDEWALMRTCRYLDRARQVARLSTVSATAQPPTLTGTWSTGTTVSITRNFA